MDYGPGRDGENGDNGTEEAVGAKQEWILGQAEAVVAAGAGAQILAEEKFKPRKNETHERDFIFRVVRVFRGSLGFLYWRDA